MNTSAEIAVIAPRGPSLPEKLEYARQLAESGLLPSHYRKQPANVLYAYEYGEMLGLAPLAAITGIHVIEGKPSASSALMSALVRRAGHRLRVFGDDEKAVAEITRGDDPEFTFRSEWTLKRARQAELLNKGTWKKYPAAMLKARAISECARDACEETLLGMAYTPEELGAETDEEGVPLRATSTRLSTVGEPVERPDEPDWDELIKTQEAAGDLDELKKTWWLAKGVRPNDAELRERISQAAERVQGAQVIIDGQTESTELVSEDAPPDTFDRGNETRRMWAQLAKGGIDPKDRERRLHVVTRMLTRATPLGSFNDLTDTEIAQAVAFMARCEALGILAEELNKMAPVATATHEAPAAKTEPVERKGKGTLSTNEIDMARNELVEAVDIAALSEVWNRYSKSFTMPPELRKVFNEQREKLQQASSGADADFDALWQQVSDEAPKEWSAKQLDDDFLRVTGKVPDKASAADVQQYLDAVAAEGSK